MHSISIKDMKHLIGINCLQMSEPQGFIGGAGCGKTAGIRQAAEEFDAFLHPVLLGQYETVDLKGTPWDGEIFAEDAPAEAGAGWKSTVWRPASTLPFIGNPLFPTDRKIILFLDEITSASIAVMGVCYQLINEKRIGEHVLMPNVEIVCAGNRDQDKGIVNRMPMPLNNRITWYEVLADVGEWCEHATAQGWPKIIVDFITFQKDLLCTYDAGKPERAFATPRTWEKASRYFMRNDYPDADGKQRLKKASIAGAVGSGPTVTLFSFVDVWAEMLTIFPEIKADPLTARLPEKLDMRWAMAVHISDLMTAKNMKGLYAYLRRLPAEFAVLGMDRAIKRDESLFHTPEFLAFTKEYKAAAQR